MPSATFLLTVKYIVTVLLYDPHLFLRRWPLGERENEMLYLVVIWIAAM